MPPAATAPAAVQHQNSLRMVFPAPDERGPIAPANANPTAGGRPPAASAPGSEESIRGSVRGGTIAARAAHFQSNSEAQSQARPCLSRTAALLQSSRAAYNDAVGKA